MTQHLHTEYVDGCMRCELSRDDTIADDAVAEGRAWRPSLHTCPHRVENATAGQCERCHRDVIANGCGPGFVFASEIGDRTGWQVCSDGLARWFGTAR